MTKHLVCAIPILKNVCINKCCRSENKWFDRLTSMRMANVKKSWCKEKASHSFHSYIEKWASSKIFPLTNKTPRWTILQASHLNPPPHLLYLPISTSHQLKLLSLPNSTSLDFALDKLNEIKNFPLMFEFKLC